MPSLHNTTNRESPSYLDFNLKPGGKVVQPVDPAFNVFAYILNGSLVFGVRLRAADMGNDDSIRHKIKLELMKHDSVPGAKPGAKSGANGPE